jgi:arabinose-5-phosphate isomerase
MILDEEGRLVGVFTDSDLARLLERQYDVALDAPVSHVMTRSPRSVLVGTMMPAAIDLLVAHKISELPVIDGDKRPLGLVDITDVLQWLPKHAEPVGEAIGTSCEPRGDACAEPPRDILPLTTRG